MSASILELLLGGAGGDCDCEVVTASHQISVIGGVYAAMYLHGDDTVIQPGDVLAHRFPDQSAMTDAHAPFVLDHMLDYPIAGSDQAADLSDLGKPMAAMTFDCVVLTYRHGKVLPMLAEIGQFRRWTSADDKAAREREAARDAKAAKANAAANSAAPLN